MRTTILAMMLLAAGYSGEAPEAPAEAEAARFELASSDKLEHGERLSYVLGCSSCHTAELTGRDWSDPEYGVLWTANLTHSAAKHSEQELIAMITEGKRPDRALVEIPSYLFTQVHPDYLAAVVGYLKTFPVTGEVHPAPTIGPALAQEIENGEYTDSVMDVAEMRGKSPPDIGPEHAWGRHIVRATCAECHKMDLRGAEAPSPDTKPRPDLRMVASYPEGDFVKLMQTRKGTGDHELSLISDLVRGRYSRLTQSEVKAVHEYLLEVARRDP